MQWLHKDLNDSEVLIVFKLPEISCSCSKRIINMFQLSQLNDYAAEGEFLDFYFKSAQENSVFKEPCVLKQE